jgi:hypothetical protein
MVKIQLDHGGKIVYFPILNATHLAWESDVFSHHGPITFLQLDHVSL